MAHFVQAEALRDGGTPYAYTIRFRDRLAANRVANPTPGVVDTVTVAECGNIPAALREAERRRDVLNAKLGKTDEA